MKKTFFFTFFILFSLFKSQISDKEYDIYSTFVGEQGLSDTSMFFGIPEEFKNYIKFDDSISIAINNLKISKFDTNKIKLLSLKYDLIDKKYTRVKSDLNLKVYCSPILFNSQELGYLFVIYLTKLLPKPQFFFLKAEKINNKWIISDYEDFF